MNFRRHLRPQEPQLNLTALIDVIFMLLVFFVLTTSFMDENYLGIVLPESESEQRREDVGLEVIIDLDGNYIVNNKKLTNNRRETLHTVLQRESQGKDYKELRITADERVPHGKVVVLMDIAGRLGFDNIRISTRNINQI